MIKDSTSIEDAKGQAVTLSRSEETLGSFLKKHRQSQGKSLEEIAEKTRIHASTLRALEEDNPKALPAEVFTRGFVKNYAQYLGLDPNEAVRRYNAQNVGGARSTENLNIQEVLAGEIMAEAWTFPLGRVLLWFLVVGAFFLVGYLLFDFLNSSLAPSSASNKEGQSQALVNPLPPLEPQSGTQAQTSLLPAVSPKTSAATAQEAHYVLEAKFIETTWVSVQIDKEKKKSLTFQPGEHAVWKAEKNISLMVGNAGGIDLILNGKPLPPLGKSMQVAMISFPAE